MSIEEELAELSTVYHGQREHMEALEQLVREVADAPVHVDEYSLKELSCVFCEPTQDVDGYPHHAATCVVERAKALLSETLSQEGK
jgi:hypothetical protein